MEFLKDFDGPYVVIYDVGGEGWKYLILRYSQMILILNVAESFQSADGQIVGCGKIDDEFFLKPLGFEEYFFDRESFQKMSRHLLRP